jgi:hypothetical protein
MWIFFKFSAALRSTMFREEEGCRRPAATTKCVAQAAGAEEERPSLGLHEQKSRCLKQNNCGNFDRRP